MTERDNVSMATVQMKPDYAASEVYSTASEAPPAYKRQSSSVKIAKIAAFTIVVSSFILGSFILASSYLQAKASCDQVQALDSVLEKELMLETLQQVNKELPRAEALLGKENIDDADLQNLDKDETAKKMEPKLEKDLTTSDGTDNAEKDNSYSESEEPEEAKWPNKVPLELDLSDLATAILQNNKKSRMNCVVERKHAEEFVDTPSKTVSLPFGMNLTTDPKKARITGERISIFCEGGNENKDQETPQKQREDENDDTEEDFDPIRAVYLPYQRLPIPFGQMPQQFPLTHMPQRMMPPQAGAAMQLPPPQQQPMIRQMPPPFQQMQMRPPMPPQVMQAPHPEPQQAMHRMPELQQPQTVRIHVQQLPFREIHVADDVPVQIPSQQQELPHFQIQRMPLIVALQRAGITAEDLRNIKRMAEDRITDELRRLAVQEAAESSENASNSSEEDNNDSQGSSGQNSSEQEQSSSSAAAAAAAAEAEADSSSSSASSSGGQEQQPSQSQQARMMEQAPIQVQRMILQTLPEQPRDTMTPPMPDQPQSAQMMQYGRATYGRSLAQPVRIPVPMMPMSMVPQHMSAVEDSKAAASAPISPESERPHFLQPRSI